MRDETGLFIGNTLCRHLRGVDRVEERTCCGGRISRYAFVKCARNGVVLAHAVCVSACVDRDYSKDFTGDRTRCV